MNPFEMVLGIVIVVMIASVLKSRYRFNGSSEGSDPVEMQRMRQEVQTLRERVQVLERIATDKESQLEREIERLRDR